MMSRPRSSSSSPTRPSRSRRPPCRPCRKLSSRRRRRCSALPSGGLTESRAVDDLLSPILASGVPGVAVVGGGVKTAAGVADLRTGEPLTAGHRFRIGSVTKIFVAALVLQLVADGILDLDATAAPFVEDVTVRQLLNH